MAQMRNLPEKEVLQFPGGLKKLYEERNFSSVETKTRKFARKLLKWVSEISIPRRVYFSRISFHLLLCFGFSGSFGRPDEIFEKLLQNWSNFRNLYDSKRLESYWTRRRTL